MLSTDQPLTSPDLDQLDRAPFARAIARTVSTLADPASIVVGVYGPWGQGKTTVLHFIEQALRSEPDVVCLWFNPWLFSDEHQLLRSFFEGLADALGRSISTRKEDLGRWLRDYAALLSPVSLSLAGLVQLSPGAAAATGEALSSTRVVELKARIEKVLRREGKRVVVLIDDIDRLERVEIHTVLKLVKLTGDFTNTAYILALDEEVVAAAIAERYGSGEHDAGKQFLEKIVQVPLHLPLANKVTLRKLCFNRVDEGMKQAGIELSEDQVSRFVQDFVSGLEPGLTNPRMAKRFGNALSFALPMLKGEVDPVDLMLLEGIRAFYPKAYTTIRDNSEVFLQGVPSGNGPGNQRFVEQRQSALALASEGLSDDQSAALKRLLRSIFPRSSDTIYGSTWDAEWAKEQRIASPSYFRRFFAYVVPQGDFPDEQIDLFLAHLSGVDEAVASMDAMLDASNAETIISKLRTKHARIPIEESRILALALAACGGAIPDPNEFFSWTTPRSQSGILISQLVENLQPGGERFSLAKEVIASAQPLSFAADCFRWLRSGSKATEDRTLSPEDEDLLGRLLADRIEAAKDELSLSAHRRYVAQILFIWAHWRSRDEASAFLAERFAAEPAEALSLVKAYASTRQTGSGTSVGDFDSESYNSLCQVVDPDCVRRALVDLGGFDMSPKEYDFSEEDVDRRMASQFAYAHHKAVNQPQPTTVAEAEVAVDKVAPKN